VSGKCSFPSDVIPRRTSRRIYVHRQILCPGVGTDMRLIKSITYGVFLERELKKNNAAARNGRPPDCPAVK
jgi:hypothetical protein